jgi:hypothetical protein
MKKIQFCLILSAALFIVFSAFKSSKSKFENEVLFPEGYRNWTHVKTYIVRPKNPSFPFIGGFNHVYANAEAMKGYKSGYFPNGSIIVSDVVVANEDSLTTREGERRHIDVMVRDSIKYDDLGGWRFETFNKSGKDTRVLTPATRNQCTSCHKINSDMVFSEYRD